MADRPRLEAPAGACDCHMHVYETAERYPVAPTAAFLPPPARVADYRQGPARASVSSGSWWSSRPPTAPTTAAPWTRWPSSAPRRARSWWSTARSSDAELERLTAAGARGIRFHMLKGGVLPWEILEEMAARVHPFGWHVQLQCNGRELPERAAMLRRLPGTLVIDHVGRFMDPVPLDHPAFDCLLGLLETGRTWVKLSAPYESSRVGPAAPTRTSARSRRRWCAPRPSACCGPPTGRIRATTDPQVRDEAELLDLLLAWAPEEATRDRILVDNPAALYGF